VVYDSPALLLGAHRPKQRSSAWAFLDFYDRRSPFNGLHILVHGFWISGKQSYTLEELGAKSGSRKASSLFFESVLERTGFTESEWTEYWHKMVTFRDKYVVHRDKYREPVPHFAKALAVAYAYDDWIRKTCFPGSWEEPPFEDQEQDTRSNIRSYIEHLASNEHRWV
jgi:hypothetical protein